MQLGLSFKKLIKVRNNLWLQYEKVHYISCYVVKKCCHYIRILNKEIQDFTKVTVYVLDGQRAGEAAGNLSRQVDVLDWQCSVSVSMEVQMCFWFCQF